MSWDQVWVLVFTLFLLAWDRNNKLGKLEDKLDNVLERLASIDEAATMMREKYAPTEAEIGMEIYEKYL